MVTLHAIQGLKARAVTAQAEAKRRPGKTLSTKFPRPEGAEPMCNNAEFSFGPTGRKIFSRFTQTFARGLASVWAVTWRAFSPVIFLAVEF
jgi:hypothetical protein